MDATHTLLKAIWVPRNVVVKEDMAALQVDAFARGLSGNQHLDFPIAKLLLGKNPSTGSIAVPNVHSTVDGADAEAPLAQHLDEVVKCVLDV